MFPASNPPTIDSINAHYDHFRALPADENAAHRETILFTTADLAGRSTSGRVIFTMGCHSALPVSDFVFGNVLKPTGRRPTRRPAPSSTWATPASVSATPPLCSTRRS